MIKVVCDICGRERPGYVLNYYDYTITRCWRCYRRDKSFNPSRCEVYSRVVGYLRPVNQWNIGKRHEFRHRRNYKNPENNQGKV